MDKLELVARPGHHPTRLGLQAFISTALALSTFAPATNKLLGPESGWSGGSSTISWWYSLPQSRNELLDMLTRKQEAKFANCMVSHFTQLAKLIPDIDKVFNAGKKRGG